MYGINKKGGKDTHKECEHQQTFSLKLKDIYPAEVFDPNESKKSAKNHTE